MDNIVLQQEDLKKLISYIHSRGFHDPAVVAEILDHFACKVEERLNTDRYLTLEKAMEKAHGDFGTLGFRPLVTAYEAHMRKKYKAVYRREFAGTLRSFPLVLATLLAGAAVYKGFLRAEMNGMRQLLQVNDVIWILITCVLAAGGLMLRRVYNRRFFGSVLATVSRNEYNWTLGVCVAFIAPAREFTETWQVYFFAVAYALATMFFILSFNARYRTVKQALEEFKAMKQAIAD